MRRPTSLVTLEMFARDRIAAHRYPSDNHVFRWLRCETCGVTPFVLRIEHHTGSQDGDFKGVIWGACSDCGSRQRLFSFTGYHRQWLRDEHPVCGCGNDDFFAAVCERIEGIEGMTGFFDEGVVVGQCCRCHRNRALVHTD